MKTLKFKVTGQTGLMLNNPQVVNPFNKYSKLLKPLTSKRTKTEDDLLEISHIKFLSCLYQDSDGRYIIPASHFEQSIISAAKERKLGRKFERSFRIFNDSLLDFPDKDKTPEELYASEKYTDIRAVGIKGSKITTTRVLFPLWGCEVECSFDESQIDPKEIVEIFEIAGERYGVGTYRRMYGHYEIQKIK